MASDGAGGCGRSPGTPRWRRQLDACVPALSIKQFSLRSAPERFDHRVAEAITDRAHRREQSEIDRATRERPRGELSLGEAPEGPIDPWTIRSTAVTSAVSVRGRISPLSAVEHRGAAGGIDPGVCNVGCRLARLPGSSHGVLTVDPHVSQVWPCPRLLRGQRRSACSGANRGRPGRGVARLARTQPPRCLRRCRGRRQHVETVTGWSRPTLRPLGCSEPLLGGCRVRPRH